MFLHCLNMFCDRYGLLDVVEICQGCSSPLTPIPDPRPNDVSAFQSDLGEHQALPEHKKVDSNGIVISTQSQISPRTTVSLSLNRHVAILLYSDN